MKPPLSTDLASNIVVHLTAPRGLISGVETMNVHLAKGLLEHGVKVNILVTEPEDFDRVEAMRNHGLPVTHLCPSEHKLPRRWKALRQVLRSTKPCVYLPNGDLDHALGVYGLPETIRTVCVLHSDDPAHYELVDIMGEYWDAVVAVSSGIRETVVRGNPKLGVRSSLIPYGVPVPEHNPSLSRAENDPLRIVYSGRIVEHQKKVSRFATIAELLRKRDLPFVFTILGTGPDGAEFREHCRDLEESGHMVFRGVVPHHQMSEELARHDVFLLTSDFEGLPLAALEAMSAGCVPVVSDIPSGVPDLIEHGRNGYRLPPENAVDYADVLQNLAQDSSRCRDLSEAAFETVRAQFNVDLMVGSYLELFSGIFESESSAGRKLGRPPLPKRHRPLFKHFLPTGLRTMLAEIRRRL